jgi:hypothetical protein
MLGIEVEVENFKGNSPPGWESKEDHSLRNSGREFTIGPVSTGQLQRAIADVCAMAKVEGWHANSRTGIHIHVNMTDKSMEFLHRFVECYLAAERTLFKYAGEWRRWCNFCQPLQDSQEPLIMLRKIMDGTLSTDYLQNLGKYAGLNIVSLAHFGTVEVRILPTTFDYAQICAWVNAIIGIYETARDMEQAGMSYIDYKKAYGLDKIIGSIFRHKNTALEFAEVLDPNDFKKAHRYIRWLEEHSSNQIGVSIKDDVSGWFKMVQHQKTAPPVVGHLLSRTSFYLSAVTTAINDAYHGEEGYPDLFFPIQYVIGASDFKARLDAFANSAGKFGVAIRDILSKNFGV